MKALRFFSVPLWVFAFFTVILLSACNGCGGNPPEEPPTPLPSPEEKPVQTVLVEDTSHPGNTPFEHSRL